MAHNHTTLREIEGYVDNGSQQSELPIDINVGTESQTVTLEAIVRKPLAYDETMGAKLDIEEARALRDTLEEVLGDIDA
ncbi:hypothetical protein [Haloarcula brevis]|uniref:hypothetical protein n=1 Tax=Haloarcula brevis TaxID=3111453 RepID=UPI00300EEE22